MYRSEGYLWSNWHLTRTIYYMSLPQSRTNATELHLMQQSRTLSWPEPFTYIKALPNYILKPQTFYPDCCASWVVTARSSRSSLSGPGSAVLFLPSLCASVRAQILFSSSVWLHSGGRKTCGIRFWIYACGMTICARCSHTLCTVLPGLGYSSTLLSTSCAVSNIVCLSAKSIWSIFLLTSPPGMAWSSTYTCAT